MPRAAQVVVDDDVEEMVDVDELDDPEADEPTTSSPAAPAAAIEPTAPEMRAWARSQGLEVPSRGRLNPTLREAYLANDPTLFRAASHLAAVPATPAPVKKAAVVKKAATPAKKAAPAKTAPVADTGSLSTSESTLTFMGISLSVSGNSVTVRAPGKLVMVAG